MPGRRPRIHLICNAHLDPVWQWGWEEGASEAVATFRTAARILREHPSLIFNHNEAILYQWVERLDPGLFAEIRKLVREGRWAVGGGWFIQPDANLPGLESIIRHISEGREYFWKKFGAMPKVAYNFDSFGHSAGLPQVLRRAGYAMYIHLRPQAAELDLPADLYRWRGCDGSEIVGLRISVGLYHTERDNIEERLKEGTELAFKIGRDIPVFWGLGDHGGGPTRGDLKRIDEFTRREKRVRFIHSTPDLLYEALKVEAKSAPVFEGGLHRVFTGCYTSLSRIKRRAQESLGRLVQAEALRAASWRLTGQTYPEDELREAWRGHLFNDFHDILTGTCTESAERDAHDLYGKVSVEVRRLQLDAAVALSGVEGKSAADGEGGPAGEGGEIGQDGWRGEILRGDENSGHAGSPIPVTVINANPACSRVPVEVECMADYRPLWTGRWHLRLYDAGGSEVPCQEEQADALLPFNAWRRKVSFMADLPGVGARCYELKLVEGSRRRETAKVLNGEPDRRRGSNSQEREETSPRGFIHHLDQKAGFIDSFKTAGGCEVLSGLLFTPLVVEDQGDSWGSELWSYRSVLGTFKPVGKPKVIERGTVRTITESIFVHKKSRIVSQTIYYPDWPVLEFRLRILWNEERKRLKLSIPSAFASPRLVCEVPGGAVIVPADGQEHVHGRWLTMEESGWDAPKLGLEGYKNVRSKLASRQNNDTPPTLALGLAHTGCHGLDFMESEVRLSVLRSSGYCHERGFLIAKRPARKFADLGVHEVRLLLTAGRADWVRKRLPGLADFLSGPPAAYAHLPSGPFIKSKIQHQFLNIPGYPPVGSARNDGMGCMSPLPGFTSLRTSSQSGIFGIELLSPTPDNIRLTACKRSHDGKALIVRFHEAAGFRTSARIKIHLSSKSPRYAEIPLRFNPFEIKTLHIDKKGRLLKSGGRRLFQDAVSRKS